MGRNSVCSHCIFFGSSNLKFEGSFFEPEVKRILTFEKYIFDILDESAKDFFEE